MPQAREACLGLRSKSREHLLIAAIDFGENFIDSRKRFPNNFGHLAPQGISSICNCYIPLAFFTATIEIAHAASR
jgi:hypothetical protein